VNPPPNLFVLTTSCSVFITVVAYDGSRYNGFQRQTASLAAARVPKRPRYNENGQKQSVAHTIQDCLEDAILSLYPQLSLESLRMRCAGRTDAGVHAKGQVVAIDVPEKLLANEDGTLWQTIKAINSRLPNDISIERIDPCCFGWEPRKEAIRKRYSYTLRYRRNVVTKDGATSNAICSSGIHTIRRAHDGACLWHCPWALDDRHMRTYCRTLSGQHDYYAFVHKEERKTQRCHKMTLTAFDYHVLDETSNEVAPVLTVQFVLEAAGFRRTMVRNLIGFVVDLCRGAIHAPLTSLEKVWDANENAAALIHAAPASGLCLERVYFQTHDEPSFIVLDEK